MSPLRFYGKILCFALLFCTLLFAEEHTSPSTAIIGAFDEEVQIIKNKMQNKQTQTIMGMKFLVGKLKGRSIVLAQTGVGKVNAAMTTTLILDHFQPTEVIFTGIAGGLNPKLQPGDIVIGEKIAQHDLGDFTSNGFIKEGVKNPINGIRNPVFIPSDPRLITLAQQASRNTTYEIIKKTKDAGKQPHVLTGTIVTGDIFIASSSKKVELRENFKADAVEMEGGAVAQVCYQQKVPFIVIRSISDEADQNAQLDIKQFYKIAARNSAELVISLIELLAHEKK